MDNKHNSLLLEWKCARIFVPGRDKLPKAHSFLPGTDNVRGQILQHLPRQMVGSITSRCSGKEPALLSRTLLGEERRLDSRNQRKWSLAKWKQFFIYPTSANRIIVN